VKRRALFALAIALQACACSKDAPATSPADAADAGAQDAAPTTTGPVSLYAVVDLPRTANTQSLSGTFFDEPTRTLWAISDRLTQMVPLAFGADYKTATVGAPIAFTGRPDPRWDGEGLARVDHQIWALTYETGPILERFGEDGAFAESIPLPAHYAQQHAGNKGIESLGLAAGFLFVANEGALTIDGELSTKTAGTTIRILRRDLATKEEHENAYRTEPLGKGTGGDMGVSDVTPLDATHLLVLERGYQSDFGNTVRIFTVTFDPAADVESVASLGPTSPVLDKTLLVDIGALPAPDGVTSPDTQPNPILDNYEGLALGPKLDDGRRLLFVTSDDNASATQVARVLVLAVTGL
jgi:hypothetical protein